jgi:polar amino acid transport system substrate-binding protein
VFKCVKRYLFYLIVLMSFTLSAAELKPINIQPSWFEQFQFAGYYIAKEKGFYHAKGLDVTINPFTIKKQKDITQDVISGKVDFAIGKENLILEKAHNKKIVVLYALFQSSPLTLITTKVSNINTLKDFVGKKVMFSPNDYQQISLRAMFSSKHLQPNDLIFVPHSHNIQDLIDKKTDVISAYVSKAPYDLEKMNVGYNIFYPRDYGFDLYSDFLYTSENYIADNTTTTKDFKDASLRGWKYAFENMEESVDIIFEKYNEQNLSKEALLFEAKELKKLAYLNTDTLGKIEENKFKKSFELYKVLGVENASIDFTQVIYDDNNPHLFLSEKEQHYLTEKQNITICVDPNWLPYEGLDDRGKHIGLNTEIFDIFRKQLPIPLEVVKTTSWKESLTFAKQRKCDLLSLAGKTDEREKYLNFTSPYLFFPRVLVTKSEMPFVSNFNELSTKTIALVRGYAQRELIVEKIPHINLINVDNIDEGLAKVANGEVYGLIDGLETVNYLLADKYLGQLKVSGQFENKREIGLAVRNDDPILFNIFEKLVTNIPAQTVSTIMDKSTSIKYVNRFNYRFVWWALLALILMTSAFLYRQHMLNKLNKTLNEKVAEKTKALQELNESLERKIKERTEKIEHSRKLLQSVAYQDNLTGIFNRHYLYEQSPLLFKRVNELNQPLSILIIDIDHFKNVNDVYGHIIGDNILKYFVKNIQKTLRVNDIFSRYGGEEFIIILPDTALDQSLIVAEKLRFYIEHHPYKLDGAKALIHITISIGVCQYQKDDTLEKLIDRADVALYHAKEKGRNQVLPSVTGCVE